MISAVCEPYAYFVRLAISIKGKIMGPDPVILHLFASGATSKNKESEQNKRGPAKQWGRLIYLQKNEHDPIFDRTVFLPFFDK